ncbi:hypothetical protein [Aestuariibius sp. HNIBRBA575]|uniref:hypothetical protein n=1 Tax=Aestuariibius sp. HNIBRBA575 TaxID=3233343 RepID=UPI0034A2390A
MVRKSAIALAMFGALSACANMDPDTLIYSNITAQMDRELQSVPFASGSVSVVTEDHGEMHTYRLVPCRGDRVCMGSEHGRQIRATETAQYVVLSGIKRHQVFYLGMGGDGFVREGNQTRPLAWE